MFYQLADEYGLMVLNDFWASTQDYQIEPQDVPLFLANAANVWIPEPDRWPISDVWAYHDWHQTGNGAVQSFMTAPATQRATDGNR